MRNDIGSIRLWQLKHILKSFESVNVNLDVIDVPSEVSSRFGLVWAAVEVEEVARTVLLLAPHDDGSLGRQHQHQQVPVLALGAEHGRLRAHLAPVPPRAGQARVDQLDAGGVTPGLNMQTMSQLCRCKGRSYPNDLMNPIVECIKALLFHSV